MSIPTDRPVEVNVKKVELKKTLDSGAKVYKIGVELNGDKEWPVEMFNPVPPPTEGTKETLILTTSEYGPKAKRPSQGRGGGGGRPSSPEERASIEAQVCLKEANAWAVAQINNGGGLLDAAQLKQATVDRAEALKAAKEILKP